MIALRRNVTPLRYPVNVGRPKEHGAKTAAALLEVAERTVQQDGLEALSVRRVAGDVGTTTRAVYSLFGSKEGLVVAGVAVFRQFAVDHPSLFALAVQRSMTSPRLAAHFDPAASEALGGLTARIARVEAAGLLGGRSVRDAVCEFHALCEGLASVELRGLMPTGREKRIWRDALTALVDGFATPRS